MSLTVLTVLREGGVYDEDWVYRLRRQVREHLPTPHDCVCLTDRPIPDMEVRPLLHEWPGYWSKLELYRPDITDNRVIYFDLDTLIVDDISPLAEYDGDFAALRDFYNPQIQASGVLAWDGSDPPPIYQRAVHGDPWLRKRSDLWWNEFCDPDILQDIFPGLIGSYKAHELDEGPDGFGVVCFHGQPRQHNFGRDHWVTRAWRGYE